MDFVCVMSKCLHWFSSFFIWFDFSIVIRFRIPWIFDFTIRRLWFLSNTNVVNGNSKWDHFFFLFDLFFVSAWFILCKPRWSSSCNLWANWNWRLLLEYHCTLQHVRLLESYSLFCLMNVVFYFFDWEIRTALVAVSWQCCRSTRDRYHHDLRRTFAKIVRNCWIRLENLHTIHRLRVSCLLLRSPPHFYH